jgi:hypothetical protein
LEGRKEEQSELRNIIRFNRFILELVWEQEHRK